ncbi:MAG: MarR family winged helix-turn-helix transcriptional regulator [Mycobacterium leprae]
MVASTDPVESRGVLPLIQLIADLIAKRCDRFLNNRYGLTMPQYLVLLAARNGRDVTLGGLSDELHCSRGNVTGIVDRLERDEWLKRERSKDDRRVIWVRLTEKGNRVTEIERELVRELATLSKVWTHLQQGQMTEMLLLMYKELQD